MQRWKIAISWRGASKVRDEGEKIVDDLLAVGPLLAEGPEGWLTAYLCVTELAEHVEMPAKLADAEAA